MKNLYDFRTPRNGFCSRRPRTAVGLRSKTTKPQPAGRPPLPSCVATAEQSPAPHPPARKELKNIVLKNAQPVASSSGGKLKT